MVTDKVLEGLASGLNEAGCTDMLAFQVDANEIAGQLIGWQWWPHSSNTQDHRDRLV